MRPAFNASASSASFKATSALDEMKFDTAVINVTAKAKYTVTVICGEHGKVTPGTGEYAEGSEVTFTVEADKGYEVSKVTVNGKDVTLKNGKFTVVINGKTAVKATFKAIKNPTTGDGFTRCSPSCWPSPHWPPLPQPSCSCAKGARTEPADAG